ncbi:MAG: HAMP domain-containing histidine kinase [Chitinispirillales bacterium]|jgi:signal transduction histidine kinase|nr:HAMP domain-containing histidine kinase [Chitinispirillales bacterium]
MWRDLISRLTADPAGQAQKTGALREALANLREAYTELETAGQPAGLGRSVASVNHDMKNHLMAVSGYASLLLASKDLSEHDRGMAGSIAQAAAKLQDLSAGVSEMSRAGLAQGGGEINLAQCLGSCIDSNFRDLSHIFSLRTIKPQDTVVVSGDLERLERAFACALRNSLEAGAQNVGIRLYNCNYMTLTVIEDDGAGCDALSLPKLSETFFTTKESDKNFGFGLGLSRIRSIIEAHNGSVGIYSKNLLGGEKRGLSVQITIPASKKLAYKPITSEIMVVTEGMGGILPDVTKTLKKLKIIPHIAETAQKVNFASRSASLTLTVFATAPQAAELKIKAGENTGINILTIEAGEGGALFVDGHERNLFTEEYAAHCLCEGQQS